MKNSGKNNISVIITVFNEVNNLDPLFNSLNNQTLKPSEVIIVDGGSTDGTFEILKKLSSKYSFKKHGGQAFKVFQVPGNRSVGRNFAVSQAKSGIIAITDAGCLPHTDWLQNLIAPFSDHNTQVVSGFYRGIAENIFQKCLIPYVLVMPDKADKQEFFPATRSMAIRKNLFVSVGGFSEKLSHNEDYAFAHKLKSLGYNFVFAKTALVDWLPRKTLKEAAWMFMRFAIGDIQAGIIRPQLKPLVIRYLAFIYLIFLTPYFPYIIYLIMFLIFIYLLYAIVKNFKYVKNIAALFWLPVIQITCDLSILFGSVVGLLSRIWT